MPLPTDIKTITVTGSYPDLNATAPTSGKVTWSVVGDVWLRSATTKVTIPPVHEVAEVDASGAWSLTLPVNDDPDLLPNGFVYTVVEHLVYTDAEGQTITVEKTGTYQLTTSLGTTVDIAQLAEVVPVTVTPPVVRTINAEGPDGSGNVAVSADDVGAIPYHAPVTLTDAATIATDASNKQSVFRVSIAGDRTLGIPTGAVDGQTLVWMVTASGSSRLLTPDGSAGGFVFGSDVAGPLDLISSGKTLELIARYDATRGHFRILSFVNGY